MRVMNASKMTEFRSKLYQSIRHYSKFYYFLKIYDLSTIMFQE